jgi:hypothetical protein
MPDVTPGGRLLMTTRERLESLLAFCREWGCREDALALAEVLGHWKPPRRATVVRPCAACGKEIVIPPGGRGHRRTCGGPCRGALCRRRKGKGADADA